MEVPGRWPVLLQMQLHQVEEFRRFVEIEIVFSCCARRQLESTQCQILVARTYFISQIFCPILLPPPLCGRFVPRSISFVSLMRLNGRICYCVLLRVGEEVGMVFKCRDKRYEAGSAGCSDETHVRALVAQQKALPAHAPRSLE